MKTQVTKLEMQFLNSIKNYTQEHFSSDNPMWCYTNDLQGVDMNIMRGVISSLIQKEIIKTDSWESKNDALSVLPKYYEVGSDYIANFINLEERQ